MLPKRRNVNEEAVQRNAALFVTELAAALSCYLQDLFLFTAFSRRFCRVRCTLACHLNSLVNASGETEFRVSVSRYSH